MGVGGGVILLTVLVTLVMYCTMFALFRFKHRPSGSAGGQRFNRLRPPQPAGENECMPPPPSRLLFVCMLIRNEKKAEIHYKQKIHPTCPLVPNDLDWIRIQSWAWLPSLHHRCHRPPDQSMTLHLYRSLRYRLRYGRDHTFGTHQRHSQGTFGACRCGWHFTPPSPLPFQMFSAHSYELHGFQGHSLVQCRPRWMFHSGVSLMAS